MHKNNKMGELTFFINGQSHKKRQEKTVTLSMQYAKNGKKSIEYNC